MDRAVRGADCQLFSVRGERERCDDWGCGRWNRNLKAFLASSNVPKAHDAVLAAGCQGFAVGANGDCENPVRMPGELERRLAGVGVPELNDAVVAAACQGFAVRRQ